MNKQYHDYGQTEGTKNVLWFSRHEPTDEQIGEACSKFKEEISEESIMIIGEGQELGSRRICNEQELQRVMDDLEGLIRQYNIIAIFGVFPPPIQRRLFYVTLNFEEMPPQGMIPCYSSWNIERSIEGERPTFEHREWVEVGYFYVNPDPIQ